MKVKVESEKAGLKFNILKMKIMASDPSISWQIDGETMRTMADFIFLGSKITTNGDCSHEIKGHLLLGRRRWWQRTRYLDGISDSMDMSWASCGRWWRRGKSGVLQSMGLKSVRHNWATEQQQNSDSCYPPTQKGFPGGTRGEEPAYQCWRYMRCVFDLWVWKIPWRRAWQPTPDSFLENPMDRGAWRATVHGVAKSQTQLSWLSTHKGILRPVNMRTGVTLQSSRVLLPINVEKVES